MSKYLWVWVILGLPSIAFGLQRIPIKDGVETQVNVSTKALTHIAVEDDRILSVKGSSNQFQLDKDEVLGQIYLQVEPTAVEPFQVFLSTEKQRSFSLTLVPSLIPAESILLTVQEAQKISAAFEQSHPYEVLVTSLIKAMHNQAPLEGYSVEAVNIKSRAAKGLNILQLLSYRGKSLRGETLQVSNTKKTEIHLLEQDFYKPGIRAISICSKTLLPGQKTTLFLVREHG